MVNSKFIPTEDKIDNIQSLKKMRFHLNISKIYDQMNYMKQSKTFQFEEDPLAKNAQSTAFTVYELLILMKFLQTKPQVESKNISYYDLYYTVIKHLTEVRQN